MNLSEIEVLERIDTDVDLTSGSQPSKLELLCKEYLTYSDPSEAFIDRFAKTFYYEDRVRKICRVLALKNKVALDEFDEVMQRVSFVFFDRMLPKLREADAIYAVVYAIANNICREIVRETMESTINHEPLDDLLARGEDLIDTGHSAQLDIDRDDEIDRQNANKRMADALNKLMTTGELKVTKAGVFNFDSVPFVTLVPVSKRELDEAEKIASESPVKKEPAAPKGRRKKGDTVAPAAELSRDQQELVDIKAKLGLRHQDFAVMLGIGLPRLSSYTYGRTATVPEDVMVRARALLEENGKSTAMAAAKFDKPMSEILSDWCSLLGTSSNEEIANYVGVTGMTIHRWKNNETKPDLTALGRYDRIVTKTASHINPTGNRVKKK
jgi:DNA-binding transcriptional regulator YiaG